MSSVKKVVIGKYRIKNNIFVSCTIELCHSDEAKTEVYLGIKAPGDTKVLRGTKILIDPRSYYEDYQPQPAHFEQLELTVTEIIAEENQRFKLICSAIQKRELPERRSALRKNAGFRVIADASDMEFAVYNGTTQGLCLRFKPKQAMVSLSVDKSYIFRIPYKKKEYLFNALIKYVIYDWKSYEHKAGVSFSELTEEQETVLNFSLDPNYTVAIPQEEKVNTAEGKISKMT